MALVAKHLPGEPATEDTMGLALFLEDQYWLKMQVAITNGIAKAFSGN